MGEKRRRRTSRSTAAAARGSPNPPTPPGHCSRGNSARVDKLGGHSLRAGFVTEAFRAGADAHAIMRQTGHRSPVMLEVYAREHAPLVGNAVTRLGL